MRASLFLAAIVFAGCGAPGMGVPANDSGFVSGDAGGPDAGSSDAGTTDAGSSSRCTVTPQRAECTSHTSSLTALVVPRAVTFEVPVGQAPATGWPAVVFFQGTLIPGSAAFAADREAQYNQYQLTRTVKALLDRGFAVVAPDALLGGATAWQSNVPPWSIAWTTSSDHQLMLKLFDAIAAGTFGALDSSRLYAMGISSGGFMTSRMAVSYPGKVRALAVHSGSYATCSITCTLPGTLPVDHPPTLFLHGEVDNKVPIATMLAYRDELATMGIPVATDINPDAGHEWIEHGPVSVPAWFEQH